MYTDAWDVYEFVRHGAWRCTRCRFIRVWENKNIYGLQDRKTKPQIALIVLLQGVQMERPMIFTTFV
jgi:hypothetical protein